jgi:DNA primase
MPKSQYVDFKAVKASVSMLQILDHYGLTERFKRSNDSLSGSCPLHNGDNPTQFRVSLAKNCWNCFGQCKRGGNVLDFVALKEGVPLRQAALRISEWFNLSFEAPNTDAGSETTKPASSQARAKSASAGDDTGPNKPLGFQLQNLDAAHPYLAERGLNKETVTEFGLGHCAKGSMSGRIVIPIHNPEGQLIAYAGRWPGEPTEGTPKYRLPAGFKKAQELFNLQRAIQQPLDVPLVIVEGFFDCIKLWQHGVKRVVALMGSTLSQKQEEMMRKHTNAQSLVLVMLDEDDAGRAGRQEIVCRLSRFCFVKLHQFENAGTQPEHLSAEQVRQIIGGVP